MCFCSRWFCIAHRSEAPCKQEHDKSIFIFNHSFGSTDRHIRDSCLKLVLFTLEATIYSIKLFVCLMSEDFWELFLVLCEFSLKYSSLFLERCIAVAITILKLYELYVIKISVNCQTTNKTQMSLWKLSSKRGRWLQCTIRRGAAVIQRAVDDPPPATCPWPWGLTAQWWRQGLPLGLRPLANNISVINKQTFWSAFTYSNQML